MSNKTLREILQFLHYPCLRKGCKCEQKIDQALSYISELKDEKTQKEIYNDQRKVV